MQQFWQVQRTLSCSHPPNLWLLQSPCSSPVMVPEPWGGTHMSVRYRCPGCDSTDTHSLTLMRHEFQFTADPCTKKLLCDSLRAVLIRGYRDTNLEGSLNLCLDVINRFCTFNFALSERDFTNWCIQLSTYKSRILTTRTEFIQRMDKNFA